MGEESEEDLLILLNSVSRYIERKTTLEIQVPAREVDEMQTEGGLRAAGCENIRQKC